MKNGAKNRSSCQIKKTRALYIRIELGFWYVISSCTFFPNKYMISMLHSRFKYSKNGADFVDMLMMDLFCQHPFEIYTGAHTAEKRIIIYYCIHLVVGITLIHHTKCVWTKIKPNYQRKRKIFSYIWANSERTQNETGQQKVYMRTVNSSKKKKKTNVERYRRV